jgi:hypothetical protein
MLLRERTSHSALCECDAGNPVRHRISLGRRVLELLQKRADKRGSGIRLRLTGVITINNRRYEITATALFPNLLLDECTVTLPDGERMNLLHEAGKLT